MIKPYKADKQTRIGIITLIQATLNRALHNNKEYNLQQRLIMDFHTSDHIILQIDQK